MRCNCFRPRNRALKLTSFQGIEFITRNNPQTTPHFPPFLHLPFDFHQIFRKGVLKMNEQLLKCERKSPRQIRGLSELVVWRSKSNPLQRTAKTYEWFINAILVAFRCWKTFHNSSRLQYIAGSSSFSAFSVLGFIFDDVSTVV